MPKTALISLATRDSKADTPGLPDGAAHVLMFWPPAWETRLEGIRKRLTRCGQWTIYTVGEFEAGDYCKGDRWLLESSRNTAARDLTAWTAGELGQPVTLQPAGETEYGPVYWVLPAAGNAGDRRQARHRSPPPPLPRPQVPVRARRPVMASAAAPSCGLHVEKHHTAPGYSVVQDGSVLEAGPRLRLRRQAEAMLAELAATGGDFALSGEQLRKSPQAAAIGIVLHKWVLRERHCCDSGEHYSPHTYAMNGRCIGPLSNGQPRRS